MRRCINSISFLYSGCVHSKYTPEITCKKYYNSIPFLDFYTQTTGESIPENYLEVLKKRHPHIDKISHDRIQCTLQILDKFGITAHNACEHLHVFSMNPITMDNYGEILRECGFVTIAPSHIIKYHTLVKSKTVAQLKKAGLLSEDIILEQNVLDTLKDWPDSHKSLENFLDAKSSILKVRMSVLERYLSWKLGVSSEEFQKYCKNYLVLKHRPMCDIQEAISIAQNEIMFDNEDIRRNGFVISADPLHTKLLLENVKTLAGMDIREVIKVEPAILKNNYNSVSEIRDILEEYQISNEAQRLCLKVYCMRPETVRERLEKFRKSKEYLMFSTNPRVLYLVVHKKKVMNRLTKMEKVNKRCYSLNHLVSSSKVFNTYINSFGDKVCGRDIAVLIVSSLHNLNGKRKQRELVAALLNQLRRHKYWLHAAINVIHENIQYLREQFHDQTIFNNCHILLYPVTEVEHYITVLLNLRAGKSRESTFTHDVNYTPQRCAALSDQQLLSLALYEIEKKYHFSGDGIWAKDSDKIDFNSLK